MALKSSHRRSFRVCADQQGFDQGGGKVHPRACRVAFPKTGFMAGTIDQAVGARGDSPCFGERVKLCILVVDCLFCEVVALMRKPRFNPWKKNQAAELD